jgi:hypothetical protein
MKTLQKIYWLRLGLGVAAALFSAGFAWATGTASSTLFDFTTLINSISIALAVYLISYYAIKSKYLTEVEKPTKLVSTGIGVYFLGWLVFWVLLYTILAGPP